jgi:ABC-type glycerol-3-phosphate transport system substrate-binding protein
MKKYFLIIVLLFATACAGNGETENTQGRGNAGTDSTATGRYVEIEITPPIEGLFTSLVAPDGTIVAFDEGFGTRYDSADNGDTWTQSAGPGSGDERFEGVRAAAILPNGNLLVYLQDHGMTTVSPDGTTEHFPIAEIDSEIAEGDTHIVSLIQVINDEQILLAYNVDWIARFMRENNTGGMMQRVEINGEDPHLDEDEEDNEDDEAEDSNENANVAVTPRTGGPQTFRTSETTQVTVSGGRMGGGGARMGAFTMGGRFESTTAIHDIATGERVFDIEEIQGTLGASNDGEVFSLWGHSILRHSFAEGFTGTLLDGTAFTFGSPTGMAVSAQALESGCILVNVLIEGQFNRLFRYTWDSNANIDPEKTITIWSLNDNELVRAAITEIWRLHPDACITYEIALSGDTGVSVSDAVRTLNTRLLSGRGPDILILDGAPIESYAGRGMMLDLVGKVDTSNVYLNLLAPYVDNGQLHVIPMQFSIPALLGSEAALEEVPTLAALVESVVTGNKSAPVIRGEGMLGGIPEEERAALHFNDLEELYDIMWQANSPAFINNNRLDSDMLREFLGAIEAISNMYELAEQNETANNMLVVGASVGGRGNGRPNMFSGSLVNYMMQSTNLGAFAITNLPMLQMMMARNDAQLAIFPGLVQGAWIPSTIVGVSADTSNPDFSIELVNTMLSAQVQQIHHGIGLPVTREGIQMQIDLMNESLAEFDSPLFEFDMDALTSQLNTPTIIETTLREMIWDTVERLCTGRIDLEGAVQEVEQSIRNYLAERS